MGVLFTNNATTTLAANLNNSATTIAVTSTATFPSISGSNYFYATFDDGTNNEVVKVTGISSNTWTIVRAQDNTTARAFSSGDQAELRLNVALLNDALGDAATFARDAFAGNGSATAFTLSQTAASENNLIVFIEGVFQTQSAYSLSGTTLTFSAAPANGREIIVYSTQALAAGTVVTAAIVDANITTAKIAADAVTGAKIADNAIDSEHYTDGSIDLAHMSANSVDSDQYVDASIDTAHITDANITTAKLANDAVTAAKLADNAVVTANITDANVTTAKIADDQITLAKLAGLARGKIIYGDSSGNPAALAVGSNGQVLKADGTDISWGTDSSNDRDGAAVFNESGADVDFRIESDDEPNAFVVNGGDDTILIGTAVSDGTVGITPRFQIEGTSKATGTMSLTRNSNDVYGPHLVLGKTRGTAVNSDTIIQDNDYLGVIAFSAADGTDRNSLAAGIHVLVDGTPGANDTPGRMVFLTTADGANGPSSRMTILSGGNVGIGTSTPSADTGVARFLQIGSSSDAHSGLVIEDNSGQWEIQNNGGMSFFYDGASKMALTTAGALTATSFNGITSKTFGTSSIMIGDSTTGTINAANYNTGLGVNVFASLTSGDENIAIGYGALDGGNPSYNIAIGNNALGAAATGSSNVAIGTGASGANTSGTFNVTVGHDAAATNETGTENTAIGYLALNANTNSSNTAVGANALKVNTVANNTAVGSGAMIANTDGTECTAVGKGALQAATSDDGATAVGYLAGRDVNGCTHTTLIGAYAGLGLTTGDKNTYVGTESGPQASAGTGTSNTGIGYNTLARVTSAASNCTLGHNAGDHITTSSYNVIIGGNAAPILTSGDGRSVIIGQGAGAALTTAGYNVAIGEEALASNQTNIYNVAVGNSALKLASSHYNVAIGNLAGAIHTSGTGKNVILGNNANAHAATGERQIVLGYNADGWQNGGAIFDIDGDYTRNDVGSATWTASSDQRQKEEITASTAGLSFINDLRPVTFKWKKKKDLPTTFKQYVEVGALDVNGIAYTEEDANERIKGNDQTTNHGFIAQEVKAVIDAHSEIKDGHKLWYQDDSNSAHGDVQNIAPAALIPMLVKALQEADDKIDALTSRVTTLEG